MLWLSLARLHQRKMLTAVRCVLGGRHNNTHDDVLTLTFLALHLLHPVRVFVWFSLGMAYSMSRVCSGRTDVVRERYRDVRDRAPKSNIARAI
jgi:hypothetical protein